MSYHIQYDMNGMTCLQQNKKKGKNRRYLPLCCLFAAMVGYCLLSKSDVSLLSILLPGATEETSLAIENMLNNISEGVPIVEAVKTFCTQVVDYAK